MHWALSNRIIQIVLLILLGLQLPYFLSPLFNSGGGYFGGSQKGTQQVEYFTIKENSTFLHDTRDGKSFNNGSWNRQLFSENEYMYDGPTEVDLWSKEIESRMYEHIPIKNWSSMKAVTKLIYNRAPKCGSTTTQVIINKLAKKNHFNYFWSRLYDEKHVNTSEQKDWLRMIAYLTEPYIYDRHIHFVNFTQYGYSMPIHINLIRDPVNRFESAYYYLRKQLKDNYTPEALNRNINTCVGEGYAECTNENRLFKIIPFFCGQEDFCIKSSSKALNKAKLNVIKYFAVVGMVEQYEGFLQILKCVFPQYFNGAVKTYELSKTKAYKVTEHREVINESNRKILADSLSLEYDFYNFIKRRFYHLVKKLTPKCASRYQ